MSFNVCPDMQGFQAITPCGLVGEPVASLQQLLGASCPDVLAVSRTLCRHLGDVCKRDLSVLEPGSEQWVHFSSGFFDCSGKCNQAKK
jgi:lipoate-protein ligase B